MIVNRSYTHNLSSCEIKAWKKFRPERASAIPVQCSTDWAIKPLEAGRFVSSCYTRRMWKIKMNIWKIGLIWNTKTPLRLLCLF